MSARLEVIAGPMFSGKTEELLRRITRATYARKRVVAIKPHLDTRTEACIASRAIVNGSPVVVSRHPATVISRQSELSDIIDTKPDTLAIDEAQFFPPWLLEVIGKALTWQKHGSLCIIASGLDLDYAREPFGPMPYLLAMADEVIKLTGVCMRCGDDRARFTQRISGGTARVQPGDADAYEVRCRTCHYIFGKEPPTTEPL